MSTPAQGLPTSSLVSASGEVDSAWRRFFVTLLNRSGGTTPQGGAPVVVTPGPSPYSYAPGAAGTLFVSGGGIERMTLRRGASPAYPVGQFYGGLPLGAGDSVTITYRRAPGLVFFPG